MELRTRSWAGVLLLATALLLLTFFAGRILPIPPSTLVPLLYVSAAGSFLLAVARFWLWRLAAGRQGASLLLWSAFLGLVGGMMLFSWLGPESFWIGVAISGSTIDIALRLAALALLAIGLILARLAPVWVAAIGLASGAAGLVGLLADGRLGLVPSLAGLGLEIVFLSATAAFLLVRRPDAEPAA